MAEALLETTRLALVGSASTLEMAEQPLGLARCGLSVRVAAGTRRSAVRRLGTSIALVILVGGYRKQRNAPIWALSVAILSATVAYAFAAFLVWLF